MNRREFLKASAVAIAGVNAASCGQWQKRPNILWIQTDEQRTDSLGCYLSDWAKTPHIDSIAREGIVFLRAFGQSPQCVPCRNSQLAARYPQELNCTFNQANLPLAPETYTFVDLLNDAGYETVTFGKSHTSFPVNWHIERRLVNNPKYAGYVRLNQKYDPGEYKIVQRPSAGERIIRGGIYPGGDDNPSTNITDWAIEYLEHNRGKRPFLLRVSHNFPHTPVLPSKFWASIYDPRVLPIRFVDEKARKTRSTWDQMAAAPQNMEKMPRDKYIQCWQNYMGLCAQVDAQVGRLLNKLDELALRDNTIIIYSSDHGACLGQFGIATKGTFDDPSWRVPFIWSWPKKIPRGQKSLDLCELMDTGKTIAWLCGLEDRVPAHWRGRNLFRDPAPAAVFGQIGYPNMNSVIGRSTKERRPYFTEMRVGVRTARYRLDYSFMRDGKQLDPVDGNLFDLEKDPEELTNLWSNDDFAAIRDKHIQLIRDWFGRIDKPVELFGTT